MTTTNKKFYYQILVWPADHDSDDYNEKRESIGFWSIEEADMAISEHLQFLSDGYKWSYITIKKMCNVWGETIEEYGTEMADCMPLECLPKYVQKKLGSIMTMTFDDYDYDVEE